MSSSDASGTKSLIFGEFASVRLPRRIVPICVSDPIGFARPRRIAITPAMVVVLTAPRPTSMMPSFPSAFSIFWGVFTTDDYITRDLVMRSFGDLGFRGNEEYGFVSQDRRRAAAGDDGRGQTGRSVSRRRRARSGARSRSWPARPASPAPRARSTPTRTAVTKAAAAIEAAGALAEVTRAPWGMWPYDEGSFDVAVIRDLLPTLTSDDRSQLRVGSPARAAPRRPRAGHRARAARRIRRAPQPPQRGRRLPTARCRRSRTAASRPSASSRIGMASCTSRGSRRLECPPNGGLQRPREFTERHEHSA